MFVNEEPVNIVIVGDGGVGKTCILISYITEKYPTDFVPTVFENFTSQIKVDEQMVALSLWDTAGQENYERLRKLSYAQADVFLVVFAVNEPGSYENAFDRWYPEISEGIKQVPKILVGNKVDMRSLDTHIQNDQACIQAQQKGFIKYVECSALTADGLKTVFEEAVKTVLFQRKKSTIPMDINKQKNKNEDQNEEPRNSCLSCYII